jgi:hypothetical protein
VTDRFKYEDIPRIPKTQLIAQLGSSDPETVARALYSATRHEEEDIAWVQNECLKKLSAPEVSVRWAAATCLGDLAFLRRPLDVKIVIAALESATSDPEIEDPASFSLSIVKQFIRLH